MKEKLSVASGFSFVNAKGHEAVVIRDCHTLNEWFASLNLEDKVNLFHFKIQRDNLSYVKIKCV